MSSRTVQIVGGPAREDAWVDGPTHALRVYLVNGGGGGGGVQYNDDSPHTPGDVGTMALVVRKDAAGSLVSADGDYAPLQVDASGALRVTGGGGGTQYAEDSAHTTGDTGTLALVVRKDTPGSLAGTDGDYAVLQVDDTGRLRVAIDAAVAIGVTQSTSPWVVSGTVAATQSGAWTVGATQSGAWTVAATQSGAWSVGITGTVAVTQSGAWSVTAVQPTHANLNATSRIQDRDSSDLLSVLQGEQNATFPMTETGIPPLFLVTDSPDALGGQWAFGRMSESGGLYVTVIGGSIAVTQATSPWVVSGTVNAVQSGAWNVGQSGTWNIGTVTTVTTVSAVSTVNAVIPGTGATNLGKAEDAPHTTGDVGVMALGVVQVAEATTAGNGDYHPFLINDLGRVKANAMLQSGGTHTSNLLEVYREADAWPTRAFGIAPLAVCFSGTDPSIADGEFSTLSVNSTRELRCAIESTISVSGVVGVSSVAPGTGASSLGKAEDAVAASGDVGVMALAVRADTAAATAANGDYHPLLVDSTGKLHVTVGNATLAVTQSGTWNIGTVTTVTTVSTVSAVTTVNAVIPGTGATNLGKAEDAVANTGDTGVMALAVRADTAAATAANGDYHPLLVDSTGKLHVSLASITASITPGTTKANLGKAEDDPSSDGDVGVLAIVVRRDTLSSTTTANGDFTTLAVTSNGALWTREYGVATIALSGSTRGRPIQITGTATGTANTLHTATTTSGELDRVYIWLTNTSTSSVTVTIEFGTTGAANELNIIVPAKETVLAVDGAVIGGAATDTIKAYAATGSVVNAFGRVERLAA